MGAAYNKDAAPVSEVLEVGLAGKRKIKMGTELIKHTYRDIEITYIEGNDKWNFTVNGRERNRESLTKAKESIDRALDNEVKERPWQPFEAWYENRYSGNRDYEKVRVTSEADRDYGRRQFWIMREVTDNKGNKEQKRVKVQMDYLFASTPENDQKIRQITELREQANKLYEEAKAVSSKLAPIVTVKSTE
jgi:hypothetical protein